MGVQVKTAYMSDPKKVAKQMYMCNKVKDDNPKLFDSIEDVTQYLKNKQLSTGNTGDDSFRMSRTWRVAARLF